MKALGIHLLIELCSCNRQKLDDMGYLETIMAQAAEVAGATVLKTAFQNFNPQGVSGVVVIAESHLTVHTWPEYGYAAIDIFTCGTRVDPWKAAVYLRQELDAVDMQVRDFQRGIPWEITDAVTSHGALEHATCGGINCQ
ncbi:MAG: adenosylmethionine decarboxylase [Deltaproteobacteria bacterium]|nr:adenosylmethionine decarboxylase [Deltaproteobacteria bacterium]